MRKHFFILLFGIWCLSLCAQTNPNKYNSQKTSSEKGEKKDSTEKNIPVGQYVWTVDERFGEITPAIEDTLPHLFQNSNFTEGPTGQYNTLGNMGSPRLTRIFMDRQLMEQFIFTQPYDFFMKKPQEFHYMNTLSPFTNLTYNSCGNKTDGEDRLQAYFATNAGKKIGFGFYLDYLYGRGYYSDQSTSLFGSNIFGSYISDKYNLHVLLTTNHMKIAENGGITNDAYITDPESYTESYSTSEIPTVLTENWNRNDNHHIFLSQRYSLGFYKSTVVADSLNKNLKKKPADKKMPEAPNLGRGKEAPHLGEDPPHQEKIPQRPIEEPMLKDGFKEQQPSKYAQETILPKKNIISDSLIANIDSLQNDSLLKDSLPKGFHYERQFVPVTSFIHTLQWDYYHRIYQAYDTPDGYYKDSYYNKDNDSIKDVTRHFSIKNTFAVALREGFNKYAQAGLKAFISYEFRHFQLPNSFTQCDSYNENNVYVGGQILRTQGSTLHFNLLGETCIAGEDMGQLKLDGRAKLSFLLFKDTIQLGAHAYIYRLNPTFYYRHYHSQHLWWDQDNMDKELRTRIEGTFTLEKTHTHLRIGVENIKNYTYFAQSYTISDEDLRLNNTVVSLQYADNIQVVSAILNQDFKVGILHWENEVAYQTTTEESIIPLPKLSLYSNMYLHFLYSKVLTIDLGADVRYFSSYYAPDYSPALGEYCVQNMDEKVKIGNYPFVNAYINFHLKHTRFYIMMSHVNSSSGNMEYFLTPHYPTNQKTVRLGISWNFFN